MQKDVFDHNFWTKALKIMILVSRSMFFEVDESDSAIYLDLDLLRSWSLWNNILGHISVINEQNDSNF